MEVHHHPDLHHKKKKFKEYFLEFLMIFLAVSMGFIAENIRESFSDRAKEEEYIKSFISNLQDDSTGIAGTIRENEEKLKNLDTLLSLSLKNMSGAVNRKLLYMFTSKAMGFFSEFKSNDATMLQLTNSGGLRFIRSDHVADSISKYDTEMKAIYAAGNLYVNATNIGILSTHELFDYTVYRDTTYFKNGEFTDKILPLLSNDNSKLKSYYNKVDFELEATKNYLVNLRARLPFTIYLIKFLREKYHLAKSENKRSRIGGKLPAG